MTVKELKEYLETLHPDTEIECICDDVPGGGMEVSREPLSPKTNMGMDQSGKLHIGYYL